MVVCVAAIANSRVMLGAHYVSDIAAGVALGSVWLTVFALIDPLVLEEIRGMGTFRDSTHAAG